MFVLKASVWLKALAQFRPDILQATRTAWEERREDGQFIRPGEEAFKTIPAESIDYAVMEHAPGAGWPIKMVPLNAGWNDLGAWDAVWSVLPKDAAGNAHVGDVVVRVDPRYFRPTEVETLLGDPSKAKAKLGWVPEITVQEMCAEMIAYDLAQAKQLALLKENGYKINFSLEW